MSKIIISHTGLIERKNILKRIFCLHYWVDEYVTDYFWGITLYTCIRCGKQKNMKHMPLNPPKEWL